MRVLITGGAGFIGQYLARATSEHDLVALDSLNPQVHANPESSVSSFPGRVIKGEVADEEAWNRLPKCDAIVHLAAETGTGQSMYEVDRYRRVNVDGTLLAAQTAQTWGVPLIGMSSRAVYGEGRYECPEHGVTFGRACCVMAQPAASKETDTHNPVSVYGETKSEGEGALADFAANIPVDVVRPQNVVGFGQALHNPYTGVLAAFLARLREGKGLQVYGDGAATRDFVHVSDVVAHLGWILRNPAPTGTVRATNTGTGVRTTLRELAEYSREAAGLENAVPIDHVNVHRAGDIEHAVADMTFPRSLGAPRALLSSKAAVTDFIQKSWDEPGADSSLWDRALDELQSRGLASSAQEKD